MSTIDHAGEAVRLIGATDTRDWNEASPYVDRRIAAAQVHATLALAEQTRIANLIALARAEGECGLQFSDETLAAVDPDYPGFALKIGDPE